MTRFALTGLFCGLSVAGALVAFATAQQGHVGKPGTGQPGTAIAAPGSGSVQGHVGSPGQGGPASIGRYALFPVTDSDKEMVLRLNTQTGETFVLQGDHWVTFAAGVQQEGHIGQFTVSVARGEHPVYLLNTVNGEVLAPSNGAWTQCVARSAMQDAAQSYHGHVGTPGSKH